MAPSAPDVQGPAWDWGERERTKSKTNRAGHDAGLEQGKGAAADTGYHSFESAANYYSEQVRWGAYAE